MTAQRAAKLTSDATICGDPSDIDKMVWIAGGTFQMGSSDYYPDEAPIHHATVDGFWMDAYAVTNEQFARFVEATKYVTAAEIPVSAKLAPGLPAELEGKSVSFCFRAPKPGEVEPAAPQWELRVGANWRHPAGEGSDLTGRERHPVVHVCYKDAVAYAQWAGKRLPTEAEWEYAARGGLVAQPYVWGSEPPPAGQKIANIRQALLPGKASGSTLSTTAVGSFSPNGYGLFDMAGNVWQLTSDWYRADYYASLVSNPDWGARRNPKGPAVSYDPAEPGLPKIVARGGSFLSGDDAFQGYRPSARMKIPPDRGTEEVGFRCLRDSATP